MQPKVVASRRFAAVLATLIFLGVCCLAHAKESGLSATGIIQPFGTAKVDRLTPAAGTGNTQLRAEAKVPPSSGTEDIAARSVSGHIYYSRIIFTKTCPYKIQVAITYIPVLSVTWSHVGWFQVKFSAPNRVPPHTANMSGGAHICVCCRFSTPRPFTWQIRRTATCTSMRRQCRASRLQRNL